MANGFSWIDEGRVAGSRRPGTLRPLDEELRLLHEAGIRAVLSLTETPLDPGALSALDLVGERVPVPDFHPPSLSDIDTAVSFIQTNVDAGRPVVVHCTAGLGRTGTILACWLVHQGVAPDTAIETIRARRPGSIETWAQEQRVFEYAAVLRGPT